MSVENVERMVALNALLSVHQQWILYFHIYIYIYMFIIFIYKHTDKFDRELSTPALEIKRRFVCRLFSPALFGGVTAFTREDFYKVNGYPNRYYGWGAEDDDMYYRY